LQALRRIGVTKVQGYLLSTPLTLSEAAGLGAHGPEMMDRTRAIVA
jgi:EAL domain-containing protein (putative c-di-GMP-specific phosphodiesterase class I)